MLRALYNTCSSRILYVVHAIILLLTSGLAGPWFNPPLTCCFVCCWLRCLDCGWAVCWLFGLLASLFPAGGRKSGSHGDLLWSTGMALRSKLASSSSYASFFNESTFRSLTSGRLLNACFLKYISYKWIIVMYVRGDIRILEVRVAQTAAVLCLTNGRFASECR